MTDYTRKILQEIRERNKKNIDLPESGVIVEEDNLNNHFDVLMEEAEEQYKKKPLTEEAQGNTTNKEDAFVIRKSDVQFGNTRQTQEDTVRKTLGDVHFEEDALKYYPSLKDVVLNGEINGIGLTFQFRYKDPSGDGVYIWGDGVQLTDTNSKLIGKVRDCFLNWKQSLVDDGDLMEKLHKASQKD